MAEQLTFLLKDRTATAQWGEALGTLLRPGDVVALIGDLGAGKTFLTRAMATGMGVRDVVTSPTFTLVQEYRGAIPMIHLDPYRLESPEDLYDLGFEEYLARPAVVVIEWANRLGPLLPPERLMLTLEIMDDAEGDEDAPRRLAATACGERYKCLLDELLSLPEVAGLREQGVGS